MKLRGLVPNFCIHVSVSNINIPKIGFNTRKRTMNLDTVLAAASVNLSTVDTDFSCCFCLPWFYSEALLSTCLFDPIVSIKYKNP
jgi:hypothetical protein